MHRRVTMIVAAALAAASVGAQAQDKYPSRSIVLISPYQAGGTTETFARLIMDDVAAILGQPIVIEQKPGAAGTIGARLVANAKGDGYTLLANTSQHVMYEGMFANLPFQPMKDFRPVGVLGSAPIIVVTREGSPYKTFRDVLEAAKTKDITFASGAQGSLPHLTGERVAVQGNFRMSHVPFSGTAPALTNVLGGHVDLLYSTAASVMPQIRGGKLRALAVSTKDRMSELPDVPTIAESGMPGFDVTAWYGVWAPKDTSQEIVDAFNKAMREASTRPDVLKRMEAVSVTPSSLTAQQFAAFAESERKTWLEVMKRANMKPSN
ncbi:tripartite tricarboxylate transporter substrate binding protein [Pigmentiphaga sp. H8]|uniref:Bug family tripartite tricarboxylate transporter substrate binding protein n=1 Tax=unclassified Pigmentiphaga TaxID=2626614 RepID=UPI000F5AF99F|nr:tripartite tricarboxylate transporter substrate binding protein [Pigmentiphaga sp. H8]AZG11194.1 tripartite tricarboxylate transporter substrate binding protein [Pigmentiphaga sp. H8]